MPLKWNGVTISVSGSHDEAGGICTVLLYEYRSGVPVAGDGQQFCKGMPAAGRRPLIVMQEPRSIDSNCAKRSFDSSKPTRSVAEPRKGVRVPDLHEKGTLTRFLPMPGLSAAWHPASLWMALATALAKTRSSAPIGCC